MADQKQDYSFTGDLSKVNPAELPESDIEAYKQTLEETMEALRKRYEKPNWFKVAAGFAKPQLGGFLASLGSASEALGENVEQQRAQELPIAQMKLQVQQANMLLGQKQKQNQIFQDWKSSGQPMDATTYSRIMSLGPNTEVAKAADKFYEGAKSGLDITMTAAKAMGADPMLQLDDFTKFQMRPDVDERQLKGRQDAFMTSLNSAKPPQIDQAQWDAMSRYEKMETSMSYAQAQREAGMGVEATMLQQADQAPKRLALLGSIRDLALGVGVPDITKDGKKVTGQQQMAALLNYFGGNNPFEVLARAAADGKLGDKLAEIDRYARQNAMSPETRDAFQKLAKLLAENQVSLRSGATNPTDQFAALQEAGSPNIGNSQTALVTLVDLMGHGEKHAIDKYRYAQDNRVPYGRLINDPKYAQKLFQYAEEHRRIATSNPLVATPSWYNPAGGMSQRPAEAPPSERPSTSAAPSGGAPSGTPRTRSNERVIGGQTYTRQPDGTWKLKGQP
jgi:hypothetical protein